MYQKSTSLSRKCTRRVQVYRGNVPEEYKFIEDMYQQSTSLSRICTRRVQVYGGYVPEKLTHNSQFCNKHIIINSAANTKYSNLKKNTK